MIIRGISVKDTNNLRKELNERLFYTVEKWRNYWYPLVPVYSNVPIIAFDSDFISKSDNIAKIITIFINHNVSAVIELQELGNARLLDGFSEKEYFLDEDEGIVLLPYMSECFWFDYNKDWTMYVSRESTIAFEGLWLVNAIKEQFPNYSSYKIRTMIQDDCSNQKI